MPLQCSIPYMFLAIGEILEISILAYLAPLEYIRLKLYGAALLALLYSVLAGLLLCTYKNRKTRGKVILDPRTERELQDMLVAGTIALASSIGIMFAAPVLLVNEALAAGTFMATFTIALVAAYKTMREKNKVAYNE